MKNHCVKIKLHSDFLYYFVFQKYKQLRLTIIIRLFTSNFSVQAPRRACKLARHEILRRWIACGQPPQDDIVFLAGASPLHPFSRVRTYMLVCFCAIWHIEFLRLALSVVWDLLAIWQGDLFVVFFFRFLFLRYRRSDPIHCRNEWRGKEGGHCEVK